MKKLIVLTVILGLSTVANAALVSINGPIATGNTTWDIVGDQLVGHNATGTADVAGVGVGDPMLGDLVVTGTSLPETVVGQMNAGDLGGIDDSVYWAGYDCWSGSAGVYAPIAGDWFVFDLSGSTGSIDLYDYGVSAFDPVGTLEIIPEPATIALLGLGGLLLRRRK